MNDQDFNPPVNGKPEGTVGGGTREEDSPDTSQQPEAVPNQD